MNPANPMPPVSRKMIWSGRVMSAVPVLMLVMSGVMKLAKTQQVVDGFAHFGFPPGMVTGLGVLELVVTAVYLVPRTAVLGAILVTGYLGGATVTMLRVGESSYLMPAILGVLAWGGLFLRDSRVRALIPFKS